VSRSWSPITGRRGGIRDSYLWAPIGRVHTLDVRAAGRPQRGEEERHMTNIDTVSEVYAAFGRGDVASIMEVLADDIEWEYGMADAGVPWLRPRTGRAGALEFFQSLSAVEFSKFEPTMLLASGDVVVALIDLACVVTATGIRIEEESEVHIWHFDEDGMVARFCHKLDSHQHWAAHRGVDVRQPVGTPTAP
jgi:ketosteroid isomerase-like protein